jgi:hypothetical protein
MQECNSGIFIGIALDIFSGFLQPFRCPESQTLHHR